MRLVVDWDGTVTVRDSLVQVIHEFGDPSLLAELEPRVGVDLTLHEEIALEFAAITAPLDEVASWVVNNVEVRTGLRELAVFRPLEVRANRLDARLDGWGVRFRDDTECATCGEPCKRVAAAGGTYAYVGDGYSDRCAAVAADRIFARDSLATYLDERGVAYEPFADLDDVAAALAS